TARAHQFIASAALAAFEAASMDVSEPVSTHPSVVGSVVNAVRKFINRFCPHRPGALGAAPLLANSQKHLPRAAWAHVSSISISKEARARHRAGRFALAQVIPEMQAARSINYAPRCRRCRNNNQLARRNLV